MNFDRWKVATVILAIIAIVLAVMLSQTMNGSVDEAAKNAIDYINKNKATLTNGAEAKLSSIDKERINLQKITVEISGTKYASYVSLDGKYLFAQEPLNLTKTLGGSTGTVESTGTTLPGNFNEAKDTEVCKENGKPIVYFFGSSTCPHCKWEEPVLKSVVEQFGDAISYHENIDSTADQDIFTKYSTGSVPTLVIGCKYYRVGSGEGSGEEAEKTALKQVICMATGNQPASICQ